jgi:mitochondrial fission protein ELM1
LRRLAPEHVRLVLVTLDSLALAPNYLVCLPPSPMDAAGARAAERDVRRFGQAAPPARVGLLVGGNSGAHRYGEADWQALTRFLREAHGTHGVRFLATTSRRSPAGIAVALAAMAAEPDSPIESFIDFRTAGPGTLARILAAADAVICTDDSTTMIAETVGACIPLVAVAPQASRLEPREAEFRQFLARQGWYRQLPIARLTAPSFLAALEAISPRTTSAREELATAIAGRLPAILAAESHDGRGRSERSEPPG